MSKVITLSLKDDVEKELRRLAIQKYGKRKGYLSKAVTVAVKEWAKTETIDPGSAKILKIMEEVRKKGYGGLMKYKREELYDR